MADFRGWWAGALIATGLALAGSGTARAEEPSHGAAAAAPEQGGEEGGDERLNWTDFSNRHTPPVVALVINFAVLLWLLVHFGRAPLGSFLAERRKKVEEDIDSAFEVKVRAEGKLRGVVLRTRNLDEELAQLREDLLRVGRDERDRLIADAGARAEKIRKEAAAGAVEAERHAARELRTWMVEQAVGAAQRTLREKLGAADQTRLADEFVRRLPAQGGQAK